jgi:ribosomal protein S18 acetylase RimI-like enzyme
MLRSLTVGSATEQTVDDLRDLYLELHHHQLTASPTRIGMAAAPDDVAWTRRRAFYTRSGCLVVRAHTNERLAGYAAWGTERGFAGWGTDAPLGVLHDLVVAQASRRQGVGSLLLDRVRSELRTAGVAALRLNVVSGNAEALAFYSRNGLQTIAQTLGAAVG